MQDNLVQADIDTLSGLYEKYYVFKKNEEFMMGKVMDHKFVSYWPSTNPAVTGYSHLLVSEKVFKKLEEKEADKNKPKDEVKEKKKKKLLEKIVYCLTC